MTTVAARVATNPFLALRSFKREDAAKFFGRDADLVLIQSRLFSSRCTLLFAAAGVGKSSFLDAKLAPAVESQWTIVTHRAWAVEPPLAALQASVAAKASAQAEPTDLVSQVEQVIDSSDGARGCLVVLDQFEEVFQHWRDSKALDEFAREVARLVHTPGLEARVLISMREEFLGELSLFDNLIPDLFNNCYRLKNATLGEAEEIITRTAMLCGVECGPGLDALLVDLVNASSRIDPARRAAPSPHGEPSPRGRIPMPFLQIVCYRLWQQQMLGAAARTVFLEQAPGPVRGELEAYCREKLKTLSAREQDLAAASFGFLMTRSGAKMAYPIDVLAEQARVDETALLAVLDRLAAEDVRILREIPAGPNSKPWFELYHDLYSRFLSDWKREHDTVGEAQRSRKSMATMAVLLIASGVVVAGLTAWRASRLEVQHVAEQLLLRAEDLKARNNLETALGIRLRLESFVRNPDLARESLRNALDSTLIEIGRYDLPDDPDLIALSPDGELLCAVDADGIRLIRLPEGTAIGEEIRRTARVSAIAFDPSGGKLAAVGWDGRIEIFGTADARPIESIDVDAIALLNGVAFSADGTLIAASGDSFEGTEHAVRVYRVGASEAPLVTVSHPAAVTAMAFSPDGRYVVTGSESGSGRLTDLQTGGSTSFYHETGIVSVAFRPEGRLLATASADGLTQTRTIPDGLATTLAGELSGSAAALAFSPNGRYLATGKGLLWDLESKPVQANSFGIGGSITSLAFTSDGQVIVAAGTTGALLVAAGSLEMLDTLSVSAPVRAMQLDQKRNWLTLALGSSIRRFSVRAGEPSPPTSDADLTARACELAAGVDPDVVTRYLEAAPLLSCRR